MGRDALFAQLQKLLVNTQYSHKTHEKKADIIDRWAKAFFWGDVVFLSLSTANLVGLAIEGLGKQWLWLGAAFNGLALLFVIVPLKWGGERRIAAHRSCATELWRVRQDLEALIADIEDGAVAADAARAERNGIVERLQAIYASAPQTDDGAYRKADKELSKPKL